MKKRRQKKNGQVHRVTWSAAGLLAVSAVIVLLCFYYITELRATLRQEAQTYLGEISSHISDSLTNKVNANLKNLETIASGLTLFPSVQSKEATAYLAQETKRYNYVSIFYAAPDGTIPGLGESYVAFGTMPFFQKALSGKPALSGLITSPLDGQDSLAYAVPVNRDGKLLGILCGITSLEEARASLSIETFRGEGFCHIVDRNGDTIVSSENKNAVKNVDNCYALWQNSTLEDGMTVEKIREEFTQGHSGAFRFNPDGMEKHLYYQPLPFNNWYLLSVVPNQTVTAKTGYFVTGTIILCSFVALLFIVLLLIIQFQQKQSKEKLRYIAYVDPVTEGPSGKRFELDAASLLCSSPPNTYAMVALNIQHFKLINEAFGQEQGNRVLRHIYQTIHEMLDKKELAVRASADHFFLLLHTTEHEALKTRLRGLWENVNRFNDALENKYFITFSQGVYTIDDTSMDLFMMEDRATTARKSAKDSGCGWGEPVFYLDLIRRRMIRNKEMENRLFQAMKHREFIVYLQPKFSLDTETVTGAEALVRWQDPELGLILPDDFIPQFERSGSIIQLDFYVFEEVLRHLKRWLDEGRQPVPISVNLSRAHLRHPEFLRRYQELCEEYGISTHLIEIEVTETLLNENPALLTNLMKRLHDLGFTCSLDDFGSGYSSLCLLKDVPVDTLKLDRAFFLSELREDTRGGMVVASILRMAHKLNMKTVAEGVEDPAQVDFLRRANCDQVQGYVYAKPLPVPAFETLAFGCSQPMLAH